MVLPTYLDIKEAAKRIEQKCHEPVTPKWLLQHASEGRLQLFALVRNVAGFGSGEDVCVMTGAKPFGSSRMNTPEKAPMCVASERVFDGDQFPLDYLDQAISVVHAIGSRVPLADEWASRLIANQTADIYTVTIDGEQASVISRIHSNWHLHKNGRVVGTARPWKVRMDDLCFRSEDIDRLIDANSSAAATHPKPPTACTETTPVTAKVGAGDTATEDEEAEQEADPPPYLTTSDLVGCFCGYMGVDNPAKVLSEYPEWATKDGALVQRGRRGAPSKTKSDISAWNPVQFALNLLDKKPLPHLSGIGHLKQQHLDTVFSMKSLAEWKPIWIANKPL